MQILVGERGAVVEQLLVVLRLAKRADGVAFHLGIGTDECGALGSLVEFTKAVERPEGVDGADPLAKRTFAECLDGLFVFAIDDQPLGGLPPEQVVAVERLDELAWAGLGQGLDF